MAEGHDWEFNGASENCSGTSRPRPTTRNHWKCRKCGEVVSTNDIDPPSPRWTPGNTIIGNDGDSYPVRSMTCEERIAASVHES